MKLTKKIEIINIFNEKVIINPIEYDIALKIIELTKEQRLLTDKIGKLFVRLYDEGKNIKENNEFKELNQLIDKLDKEERKLRKKYNYWYCGLDNLDISDKENLENKYPRIK
ncbi:Uncharacterised protein [[Clostridium] sordellii]|uniref:hypothetical protein n=1 Tax=Paraclostridium sordellii TaxID=1505 RepID=UPI0005DB3F8A|nr:hypothetical protein [Paeniclostridium sordellii]CEN25448.1 Uncharacterised protein [[Clostridium] sordellii] [Paeniclostridium sordellii]